MRIRPATPDDAAAIAAIYNHAVENTTATFDTEPVTAESRKTWLAARGPEHPVVVAEDGEAVVGWAALSPWSDRCAYRSSVEMSVYVDPQHHRRGIGRALAEHLIGVAPSLGVHAILARICTENAPSLAMVEKLGFEPCGVQREVGRKFDRWLDVAVYELLLD
ncbi:N-acetyltransferase family protein [Coriobacteriia bacterium Es71-Z0120]|uniref:GNAT family N-acetyltransferase n=1 Tax=Parvivirga hydrogeniphila TaxID=2939460 RepID=UPI00226093F2|nr:GNAT family N-acetyltransferase [Parvivirga hydrogeniphila]MCL4078678.1 N-acetyltransferase family protein [Parvivirga hydrogeniphila]